MIELQLIAAMGLAGLACFVVALVYAYRVKRGLDQLGALALELESTLTALRSNCFIPDERGVKVRYSQASAQRRVKAETPRADKV
jgi:hypothetical protein